MLFLPILDNFQVFAKVPYLRVKFNKKYGSEVAKYLRKGQVLCKNGAQSTQKLSYLNYSDGFDKGDLENLPDRRFVQIRQFWS